MATYRNRSNQEQVIELFCDKDNAQFKYRKPTWLPEEAVRRIGFA